jgi:hypothetical protein
MSAVNPSNQGVCENLKNISKNSCGKSQSVYLHGSLLGGLEFERTKGLRKK